MHIILFEIHNNTHVKNNLTQPFYLRSPSISLTELTETVFADLYIYLKRTKTSRIA